MLRLRSLDDLATLTFVLSLRHCTCTQLSLLNLFNHAASAFHFLAPQLHSLLGGEGIGTGGVRDVTQGWLHGLCTAALTRFRLCAALL